MNVYKAEVLERFDPNFNQKFLAKIRGENEALVQVNLTSPYASNGLAGFVGHVPEVGTVVLITKIDGEYYFLAATFDYTLDTTNEAKVSGFKIGEYGKVSPSEQKVPLREGMGTPDEVRLQHSLGQGLKLVNKMSSTAMDVRAELYTSKGKRISANDNPKVNSIVLDADSLGTGTSRLELSAEDPQNNTSPGHAFRVLTSGPQRLISTTGEMEFLVQDGTEMNVLNSSTGANSEGAGSSYWGNVNIQSKNRDVNVFTRADDGRIFIECLSSAGPQQIVIETNSSDGTITISSKGMVNIVGEDVNIEAKNNLKLLAGNQIGISSNMINVLGSGPVAVDGATLNLNSGTAVVDPTPVPEPPQSHYDNIGVTTP